MECESQCDGKDCGGDGCGGLCGTCDDGWNCEAGICEEEVCVPDCGGLECGSDGCGGECGECPDNALCDGGECACDVDFEWSPDGLVCWPLCPDLSSYDPEAEACLCSDDALLGLDGMTCLSECPVNSTPLDGVCVCDEGTDYDANEGVCVVPPIICDLGGIDYPPPVDPDADRFGKTKFTENKYPVILDKLTGLMWHGCDAGKDGYSCGGGNLSTKKPASAKSFCENSSWAGFDDWRLPTIEDLLALVDNGLSEQYGASEFFWYYDDVKVGDTWWSSTKPEYTSCPQECFLALSKDDPEEFGCQWYIQYAYASFGRRVRCVRNPEPPAEHCAEILSAMPGERVVHMEVADLYWQGCPAGQSGDDCEVGSASKMGLPESIQYCDDLDWGGFDDWYLPLLNHYLTIVDFNALDEPLWNPLLFPIDGPVSYWTATEAPEETDGWVFDFQAGQAVGTGVDLTWAVRCVR